MRKLTPEQRSEIARKAVAAREVKRRAAKKSAVGSRRRACGLPSCPPEKCLILGGRQSERGQIGDGARLFGGAEAFC